ncbi:MarR family winged helix-turn-helix transcriptional regulator [Methylobacterium nigriterrae]|uniref:MarR family winged helix-turn-helix transcriptional regulator n=1 Tax=Methylobacterium nigriterrae TaxID=3127512 RepID=UPI003013B59F
MNTDPSLCSNAVLRQAMRSLGQLYDDALAPSGLRATQHGLLATIAALGSPTMGALAEALVMDLSGLGHTLKPLARDGYVRLVPDERDRRARRVSLSDAGRAKLGETTALWRAAQDRFEAAFGPIEAAHLRRVLGHLASREFRDAFLAGSSARPSADPE